MSKIDIQLELSKVNYSYDENYLPSLETIKFVQFIRDVSNGGEENKTPDCHLKLLDKLFSKNSKRKAIMCARGMGKTSLVAEFGLLYGACFNTLFGLDDLQVVMYIGNSMTRGVKDLRRQIESRYYNSPYLQKMIPNQKFKWEGTDTTSKYPMPLSENDLNDIHNAGINITDTRLELVNVNKRPFVIRCFGIASGIRGFKEHMQRPQMAIFDDIIKDIEASSQVTMEKIEDIVYKAVGQALHPTNKMQIWIGTPFNSKDPLYKAIESGSWDYMLLPICERFPCDEKDFKGAWEDRFPYSAIKEEYNVLVSQGQVKAFYQELMLQITPDEDLLVPRGNVKEIEDKVLREISQDNFNFYITTDFAFTEKESSDYSVISVFAVNSNQDFILVDGNIYKQDMRKTIDELFKYAQKYRPLEVGIEITGQQIGFVSLLEKEQLIKQIYFRIRQIRPTKDKFSRFALFTPRFLAQKIHITSRMLNSAYGKEFEDELYKVTKNGFKSKHDDILDTFSMLQDLDIIYPMYQEKSFKQINGIITEEGIEDIFYKDKQDMSINNTIF